MSRSVAIFGVGRVGARMAEELLRTRSVANLYLANRSRRKLAGTIDSLTVFSDILKSGAQIHKFTRACLESVSCVIIAIKDSYDPRELQRDISHEYPRWFPKNVRTIGFRRDLPLMYDVARQIAGYRGLVVLITNPVDLFAALLSSWLPNTTVCGFGLALDAARFLVNVSRHSSLPTLDWRHFPVGGTHDSHVVPLMSMWPHAWRSTMSDADIIHILDRSRSIGPRIVTNLGYTLHDCVSVFSRDVRHLLSKHSREGFLSAALASDGFVMGGPLSCGAHGLRSELRLASAHERDLVQSVTKRESEFHLRVRSDPSFTSMVPIDKPIRNA